MPTPSRPGPVAVALARALLILALAAALLAIPVPVPPARAGEDLVATTYAQLDQLRDRKLAQLRNYVARIEGLAHQARQDPVLLEFFGIKRSFLELQGQAPPPAAARSALAEAEARLRDHALSRYPAFHDILFIDHAGKIFHTIRHESDHGQELFATRLRESGLGQHLQGKPGGGFVDYEWYEASGEPSAFLVEPVSDDGRGGWLVLQVTIGKLNRIFDRQRDLGTTGEVFLVNQQRLMLTDSRFYAHSSILRQHLSRANISSKFAEGRGHKIVTDYRDERALTAFEVVSVLGSQWLLIAKIDEDEVITRAWRRRELESALLATAATERASPMAPPPPVPGALRVDLDEFHRADPGQTLVTFGVSTCTAVLVGRPGHFAYLGHASPYDRIYGEGDMDLVAHMLERVRRFEVYPCEVRELRAVVVAPHRRSAQQVVDRLLGAGLFLDQITFVHDPGASRADIRHDPAAGVTLVRWVDADGRDRWVDASRLPDLGRLAERILGYDQAVRAADTGVPITSGGTDRSRARTPTPAAPGTP